MTITAIIVTHNRPEKLAQCIRALQQGTQRPDAVVIVDNHSKQATVDTIERHAAKWPAIRHLRSTQNIGGSGGFALGIDYALHHLPDAQWLWLMDDDSHPTTNCLSALTGAATNFSADYQPEILCSRVEWTDGSLHPMNIPAIKQRFHQEFLWQAAQHQCMSIRSGTFVSMLIRQPSLIDKQLPIADYFIWNDDVEFSARLLKTGYGVAVPNSVCIHDTPCPHGVHDAEPGKFFYYLRNRLWMIWWSSALHGNERLATLLSTVWESMRYARKRRYAPRSMYWLGKAVFSSLKRPKRQAIGSMYTV